VGNGDESPEMTSSELTFVNFANNNLRFWNSYFQRLSHLQKVGQIVTAGMTDPVPSFPSVVLCTELPEHFAVELLGARRSFRPLKLKKHHLSDTDSYLGQFTRAPGMAAMIDLPGHHSGVTNLCLMPEVDQARLDGRFQGVAETFPTKLVFAGEPDAMPIRLYPTSDFICIENCLLINSFEGALRIRHIREMLLIKKGTSATQYSDYLGREFELVLGRPPRGWMVVEAGDAEAIFQSAQFSNAFLLNRLRETTLGTYLDEHAEILTKAFDATEIISEPFLSWAHPPPESDEAAINPDLLVRRRDGFWDVYDLKLPLLEKTTITQGKKSRRRFISTIEDGLAQIAHYRDFLSIPENRELAREKYGIEFDNPHFGLIAGNAENYNSEEVREALRRFPDFTLTDYDSLSQLYLARTRITSR
jgi:hypothetical protein